MMVAAMTLLEGSVNLAMAMCGAGMFLAFIRLVRGPSLPDRVVALDLMGLLAVGIIAIYHIAAEQPALLDAATVLALVAFLATVAFARYVERRGRDE